MHDHHGTPLARRALLAALPLAALSGCVQRTTPMPARHAVDHYTQVVDALIAAMGTVRELNWEGGATALQPVEPCTDEYHPGRWEADDNLYHSPGEGMDWAGRFPHPDAVRGEPTATRRPCPAPQAPSRSSSCSPSPALTRSAGSSSLHSASPRSSWCWLLIQYIARVPGRHGALGLIIALSVFAAIGRDPSMTALGRLTRARRGGDRSGASLEDEALPGPDPTLQVP